MANPSHRYIKRRFMPWPYCIKCGLIRLGNRATERAVKRPCPEDND